MKPEPRVSTAIGETSPNRYVGEEDLSDDDEPLPEYKSWSQDEAPYREYTLRVLPWVDWDTLFSESYAEDDSLLESTSASSSEDDVGKGAASAHRENLTARDEAKAEFARREYILARFPRPATNTQGKQEPQNLPQISLRAGNIAPAVPGGPRYHAGGFARLCREGEETLRERQEALAEAERIDAQLADGTAPWYRQRRDLEGIAQIPERYRKRLMLEVEEDTDFTSPGSSSDRAGANVVEKTSAERAISNLSSSGDQQKPVAKRRRVYYGTMDSALGSDYCLMIVRDERTIDLVPVGRYAWYNFKYAPKLSDMANERMHRREARAAAAAAAHHERSSEEATGAFTTTTAASEANDGVEPENDPLLMAERKLKARASLADSILERRRHIWDHSMSTSGLRPVELSRRRVEEEDDTRSERLRERGKYGTNTLLDPLALLSRYDSESGTDSNVEDHSDEETAGSFLGRGRQTPDGSLGPSVDASSAKVDRASHQEEGPVTRSPLHASGSGSESQSSLERLERYQGEDPLLHRTFPEDTEASLEHTHRSHLSENGRMLKRLLERERGSGSAAASLPDTGSDATAKPADTSRASASSTVYGRGSATHRQNRMYSIATGDAGRAGAGNPAGSLPALPGDLFPPVDASIEEAHVHAALRHLHQQGVNLTVKEFLSYFQPWFPAQKDRIASIVRKLCIAREIPPGSGRICVLLREQTGLPPRSPS
ncbi:hypothetical protein CCYA_CCYA09G2592 [Cyanidiococcus yangmingshanensis]|nr:hypothetical protein CCYA_CCYA09G2592 [Cyanidiococcus yangmingshanensis]